jgi:hypothetical protein
MRNIITELAGIGNPGDTEDYLNDDWISKCMPSQIKFYLEILLEQGSQSVIGAAYNRFIRPQLRKNHYTGGCKMKIGDVKELHYITGITNVPSILSLGILCFNKTQRIKHESVADMDIQEIRAKKTVAAGLPLHDYENLYISARNSMLFRLKYLHFSLCVLRIENDVLNLPEVIISDGNAAAESTRFSESPGGLRRLNSQMVFAERWNEEGDSSETRDIKETAMQAEVLVPGQIDPSWIFGAYVSGQRGLRGIETSGIKIPVEIDSHLFFIC